MGIIVVNPQGIGINLLKLSHGVIDKILIGQSHVNKILRGIDALPAQKLIHLTSDMFQISPGL